MSYCRWSNSDVYMYEHVGGFVECCMCKLAPKVPSIYTKGTKHYPEDDVRRKLFGDIDACEHCGGKGCDVCTMSDSLHFKTYQEALDHLYEHIKMGDYVPDYAIEALKEDIKSGKLPGEQ